MFVQESGCRRICRRGPTYWMQQLIKINFHTQSRKTGPSVILAACVHKNKKHTLTHTSLVSPRFWLHLLQRSLTWDGCWYQIRVKSLPFLEWLFRKFMLCGVSSSWSFFQLPKYYVNMVGRSRGLNRPCCEHIFSVNCTFYSIKLFMICFLLD